MKLRLSHTKNTRRSLITKLLDVIESKPASDRLILRLLFFTMLGSFLVVVITWNNSFTLETPTSGGMITEGVIGIPRFVNPALAVTRADQDITALVYAGLMKIDPNGNLIPDLAESVTISGDGKIYNVILRHNLQFHDNTPLTARDVSFTISLIQDANLKSPLRGNWSDVTVEEINDYELNIILKEPYTPFIENFTVGILPRHIWSELPIEQIPFSQRNTEPIGAGPFAVETIVRNEAGLIDAYTLKQFTANQSVKLQGFEMRFYQNEADLVKAFTNHDIMSTVHLPASTVRELKATSDYTIIEESLPRIFAVFFNQNRSPALRDTAVRLALTTAIDRPLLVETALGGFGVPTNTPVPNTIATVESRSTTTGTTSPLLSATTILTKAGWTKNNTGNWEKRIDGEIRPLTITLRTANTPVFEQTTEVIARAWRELGVTVQVEQFEQSDLLQAVIRPRDFESLLFGVDISRAVDLYPFWHSSQREDPGLNIAQYANIEVDRLLVQARTASSSTERDYANQAISTILARETPAAFLYVPNMTYVFDPHITTVAMTGISKPHERFMNINEWHLQTDQLWPIFR
jgi:peptide/nickel transport system substrate-binding protein